MNARLLLGPKALAAALLSGAVALSACNDGPGFTYLRGDTIAVTVGDFDDVQAPFNRMAIDTVRYEGLISYPTWVEHELDYNPPSLNVEGLLLADNNDELRNHRIVFLSSGTRGFGMREYNSLQPDDHLVTDPDVVSNVRAYVNGGGKLWLTDWTYDLIPRTFPGHVTFLGDDSVLDAAQRGDIGSIQASVVDDQLREALDTDVLNLNMNYSNWAVPEALRGEAGVRVYLEGDVTYRATDGGGTQELSRVPLLFSISAGELGGTVIYSAFHIDAQQPVVIDSILNTVLGDIDLEVSVRDRGTD
ncbi:MAG: hypothetical protein EA397_08565 [Deltaproteobacteria bacterium]|nr:MAG: hypothetical protein EA397_08565 [Deltaproteobacteria bacterium]